MDEEQKLYDDNYITIGQLNKLKGEQMRYEYTVTKDSGEAEIMKAMSWKKLFKSLLLKYPKFSGWCTYINKHGHVQVRSFRKGKEEKKPKATTQKQWVKGYNKWKEEHESTK